MTASEVPPESKSEIPPKRKGWLDPATWAGIFSIVVVLPFWYLVLQVQEDVPGIQGGLLFVMCPPPGILLSALLAALGIVSARKEKSRRGLWLSAAALILAVGLFFAYLRFYFAFARANS